MVDSERRHQAWSLKPKAHRAWISVYISSLTQKINIHRIVLTEQSTRRTNVRGQYSFSCFVLDSSLDPTRKFRNIILRLSRRGCVLWASWGCECGGGLEVSTDMAWPFPLKLLYCNTIFNCVSIIILLLCNLQNVHYHFRWSLLVVHYSQL